MVRRGRRHSTECLPSMPSVYVYPLPHALTGASLYENLTAGDHDYHFRAELELTERFRAMPQAPPETADMLLVPFMLTQAFTKLRKGRNTPGHAQLLAWNDAVIAAMRGIGSFWDTRRSHHAVFAQRCAGPPFERNGLRSRSVAVGTWPSLWDEPNVTLLCFEPTTLTQMGRGILIPYGVGHGALDERCPGTSHAHGPPAFSAPRKSLLMFAGSIATNPARKPWVEAMTSVGEPECALVLFNPSSRKQHFNPSDLEATLRASSFSVQLKGHVGPRKAIFDSIRCGALPVIASDRTPLPFSDGIDYGEFALRVPERANVTRVLARLARISEQELRARRAAMAAAAHALDCGPHGGMADAILARFASVAERRIRAVPSGTSTPLPLLDF